MIDQEYATAALETMEIIGSLDDRGAEALRLLIDGATIAEIADDFGVTADTAAKILRDAVRAVRVAIDEEAPVDVMQIARARGADAKCAMMVARRHGGWSVRGRVYVQRWRETSVDLDMKIARWDDVRRGPYLYVLRWAGTNVVKIGHTGDLRDRFESIRGSMPFPVEALAFREGSAHDERRLHQRFASTRVGGEWFDLAPEALAALLGEGWYAWDEMAAVQSAWAADWDARRIALREVLARESAEAEASRDVRHYVDTQVQALKLARRRRSNGGSSSASRRQSA